MGWVVVGDPAGCGADRWSTSVVGEVLQFLGGGAVQQGGQPDERLVRVHVGVGAPPLEQLALPVGGQGRAAERHGLRCFHPCGGVDQHQPTTQRVAAELAQPGQVGGASAGMGVQERLDVADIDSGPVGLAAAGDQELREVTHRGEPGLERGVPARVGAGAAGTIAAGDQVLGEPGHRRPQWFGHGVDAGLSAGGGAAFVAVRRQRQLARGEEVFQRPRERHVGGDSFQQCLRMHRG